MRVPGSPPKSLSHTITTAIVCLSLCVCVTHISVQVSIYFLHMQMPERNIKYLFLPCCHETGSLTELESCHFNEAWLTANSEDLPVCIPDCWGYRHAKACVTLYIDDGDKTHVLRLQEQELLPTEPCSQSANSNFSVIAMKSMKRSEHILVMCLWICEIEKDRKTKSSYS